MNTTLNKIRAHHPCEEWWTKLLSYLGKTKADDETLQFLTILESNGLDDALWCLRSTPEYDRDSRLFAVWCARQIQHLMTDQRSLNALDIAEQFANGETTQESLAATRDAARDAVWNAALDAARDAARAAAWDAARDAVWNAARAAARAAAWDAARAAARDTARDTDGAAAWNAAWAATRSAQLEMFVKMCSGKAPWQANGE